MDGREPEGKIARVVGAGRPPSHSESEFVRNDDWDSLAY
jgi:hypothetical protein